MEYLCPKHKQGITGHELYLLAMENAKRWNHGTLPSAHICYGFLFSALHYPDEEFKFKVPPITLVDYSGMIRDGELIEEKKA
jgi:hypothetical protein